MKSPPLAAVFVAREARRVGIGPARPASRRDRIRHQRRAGARGLVLLEVVLSLGLLLIAIAMIGVAFSNDDHNAIKAVENSRAVMLCEQIVTRLDNGDFQDQQQVSGGFGDEGPQGWAWSLKIEKDANVEGMNHVTVRIVDGDPEGDADAQRPVLTTYMLRAEKKNFDLVNDMGMSADQVQQLTEAIPGGSAALDPTNFDPAAFAKLDMETLQSMLPILMQTLASSAGSAGGLPGGMGGSGQQGGPRNSAGTSPRQSDQPAAVQPDGGPEGQGENTSNGSNRPRTRRNAFSNGAGGGQ